MAKDFPELLTIIVPRHPPRGEEIETLIKNAGLSLARRSKGEDINDKTQIYLADTIGELGLFYRLSPITFIGGSLIPHGGQNILEPMRLKNAVIVGPHTHNFKEICAKATEAKALIRIENKEDLSAEICRLLKEPKETEKFAQNGVELAENEAETIVAVANRLNLLINEGS